MEVSTSTIVPDDGEDEGEALPENKLTLDNLAEGSHYSRLLFTSFITWTLVTGIQVLKLTVEGLVPYKIIFREMKKQSQTEIMMYLHQVTLNVPASPASPFTSSTSATSATPERARPPHLFLLLRSLLNVKTMRMKTFMTAYFHLMNSK